MLDIDRPLAVIVTPQLQFLTSYSLLPPDEHLHSTEDGVQQNSFEAALLSDYIND